MVLLGTALVLFKNEMHALQPTHMHDMYVTKLHRHLFMQQNIGIKDTQLALQIVSNCQKKDMTSMFCLSNTNKQQNLGEAV